MELPGTWAHDSLVRINVTKDGLASRIRRCDPSSSSFKTGPVSYVQVEVWNAGVLRVTVGLRRGYVESERVGKHQ